MSSHSPPELESLVRQRAPEIARDIRSAAKSAVNEAEFIAAIEPILERFAGYLDVTLRHDRERTLINGRADAVYNRFVIEYEPPQSLRKDPGYRTNQHAIGQVKQYMTELERLDRHQKERLAGVVLDGEIFIFVRFREDFWRIDDPVAVDAESTATFLRYLLSLSTELALTPENLVRDFGENTIVSRQWVSTLYAKLGETKHARVHALFQQWQLQFGEISGWESQSRNLELVSIARNFGIRDRELDPLRFFYAVHTYYATFIKILAVQIAHYYLLPEQTKSLSELAKATGEDLHRYFTHIEQGGLFKEVGVKNFLEGDFFGWFLDIWDEDIEGITRRLMRDLGNYSLVTLDVDPEETRDLLKLLYQNLMPRRLRHALGEYYTPDWLAERVINQIGFDGNPEKRVLDPACGSGTFLVLLIRRVKKYAFEHNLNPQEVLGKIVLNVVGYDLNPLAVISARTNYLLALGELLVHRQGDIHIPVYLADSILTPSAGKDLFSHIAYSFNTAVGRFSVPQKLVEPNRIERYAVLLEECVAQNIGPEEFKDRLLEIFRDDELDRAQIYVALELFDTLRDLEAKRINGIWARIIKNAFAPLFQGQFDFIVGNPPWINWTSLPEEYKTATSSLWQQYRLFLHKGLAARLGSAGDDICVLMMYVALDRYLQFGGTLGFILTQSLFKSRGGGEGFRTFRLGETPIKILHVDDMVALQPFSSASNRTSVVIMRKGERTKYPVPYTLWKKIRPGGIREDWPIEKVLQATDRLRHLARPIDRNDLLSPWMTGRQAAVASVDSVLGPSEYRARKGLETSMAGVYRLNLHSARQDGFIEVYNSSEHSKGHIDQIQAVLEPEFVFPYLRGRDVHRWTSVAQSCILVPQDPQQPSRGFPSEQLEANFPNTFAYLNRFRAELSSRAVYRKLLAPSGEPFYAMYNVGDYTFAPYKLIWRYIASELMCTVIGSTNFVGLGTKTIVPDSKLVLVSFEDEEEAHFLCAVLNSILARYIAACYVVGTQISTHILDFIAVPRFERDNALHQRLVLSSLQAHSVAAAGNSVEEIEREIDALAATLWGIGEGNLEIIRQSLLEMSK